MSNRITYFQHKATKKAKIYSSTSIFITLIIFIIGLYLYYQGNKLKNSTYDEQKIEVSNQRIEQSTKEVCNQNDDNPRNTNTHTNNCHTETTYEYFCSYNFQIYRKGLNAKNIMNNNIGIVNTPIQDQCSNSQYPICESTGRNQNKQHGGQYYFTGEQNCGNTYFTDNPYEDGKSSKKAGMVLLVISIIGFVLIILICVCVCIFHKRQFKKNHSDEQDQKSDEYDNNDTIEQNMLIDNIQQKQQVHGMQGYNQQNNVQGQNMHPQQNFQNNMMQGQNMYQQNQPDNIMQGMNMDQQQNQTDNLTLGHNMYQEQNQPDIMTQEHDMNQQQNNQNNMDQ